MKLREWAGIVLVAGCSSDPVVTEDAGQPDSGMSKPDAAEASKDSPSKETGSDAGDAGVEDSPIVDVVSDAFDGGCFWIEQEQSNNKPSWKAVDLHVYAAPFGTINDNMVTLNATFSKVLAPAHEFDTISQTFRSKYTHSAPYDKEITTGLSDAGYPTDTCFQISDLSPPSGLMISMNLIPSQWAVNGVSFENPNQAPVIVGTDMYVDADLYINGNLVDPNFDSTYPKANFVYGYPEVFLDGFAHKQINFAENQDFSPNMLTSGDYTLRIKITVGNDSTIDVVHFTVK